MVRGIWIDEVDSVRRPIIAVGDDYPDGHVLPPHQHRRGQLVFGASGTVILTTPHGASIIPPRRGMWIPAGIVHSVRMLGPVRLQSLYLEPEMAGSMPDRCQVVGMPPFMRSLIAEALDLPVEYDPDGRDGALMMLIMHEMRQLRVLPLWLPYPTHGPLARRCWQYLAKPAAHETTETWSDLLGMSRRAFTRLFRRETGLSFVTWRQQACLTAALPRLMAGEAVTAVALDLGYNNPAAFTVMFKRVLGVSPRTYLKQND